MKNQGLLKKAEDFLNKTSQRRSRLDRLMDYNPMNSAVEYFNDEVKSMMTKIRKNDYDIRKIFLPSNKKSPHQLIKNCEMLFKKREYMQCVILLSEIRVKLNDASKKSEEIKEDINTNYKNFFISKLKGKEKSDLMKLRDSMKQAKSRASSNAQLVFIKEAGLIDWLRSSIFTQRGRALRAWEKAHGEEVVKLKEGILNVINETKELLINANESLKEMSVSISRRDISSYFRAIKEFSKINKEFNNMFTKLYNDSIKEMIDDLIEEDKETEGDRIALLPEKKNDVIFTDDTDGIGGRSALNPLPPKADKNNS